MSLTRTRQQPVAHSSQSIAVRARYKCGVERGKRYPMFENQNARQNIRLCQQQQARLAQGIKEARAAAAMRERGARDRRHRLHALLQALTGWRAAYEYRSWDH